MCQWERIEWDCSHPPQLPHIPKSWIGSKSPTFKFLSIYYVLFRRLQDNLIKSVAGLDAALLTNLHTLELRGNQLTTTLGIEIPSLKNLYLVSR